MPDRARAASREAPVGTIRYSTCSGTVCAVEHWTPPSLKCSTRGNTRGRASGTKGRGGCEGLRLPEGKPLWRPLHDQPFCCRDDGATPRDHLSCRTAPNRSTSSEN